LVHGVLERLFGLPAVERTPARAADMVEPEWRRLVTEEPELAGLFAGESRECLARWLAGAEQLLSAYFALEDPRRVEPADRELCVETTLASGLRLRGYVDRLDVSSGGALRVVDYKTGRAPPPEIEARALFQMRFYALVLWRERDIVPRLLQLLFLGSGEVLSYRPDEADLLAMERKLEAVWRAISRAERDGDWRPRPGARCEWCAHREALCPAWGGTPPPLPASATSEASVASAEGPSAAVGGAGPVGGCPAGEGGAPSPYAAPDDI
jgi:putative RecB family exonuclease